MSFNVLTWEACKHQSLLYTKKLLVLEATIQCITKNILTQQSQKWGSTDQRRWLFTRTTNITRYNPLPLLLPIYLYCKLMISQMLQLCRYPSQVCRRSHCGTAPRLTLYNHYPSPVRECRWCVIDRPTALYKQWQTRLPTVLYQISSFLILKPYQW